MICKSRACYRAVIGKSLQNYQGSLCPSDRRKDKLNFLLKEPELSIRILRGGAVFGGTIKYVFN
jgi:hypothetical protein